MRIRPPKPIKIGSCVVCGAEFVKRTNKKTCGDGCAKKLQNAYFKAYNANPSRRESEGLTAGEPWESRAREMTPCIVCGKEFEKTSRLRVCGSQCWEAKQASRFRPNPIDPFPGDTDRDAFGHWLSGFADGEATFGMRVIHDKSRDRFQCTAYFRITLRDDDTRTLRLIQSFWGCGRLYFSGNARSKIPNANPITIYSIQSISDITRVVLPHFDRYPLRAKKRNDLAVWRQGVELMAAVQSRPKVARPGAGGRLSEMDGRRKRTFWLPFGDPNGRSPLRSGGLNSGSGLLLRHAEVKETPKLNS